LTDVRKAALAGGADAGMFVFGIVMALLGAVLPLLSKQIAFDLAQAGNLFLVMNCAMLVSMLSLGALTDRLGGKPVLIGGALAVAAALALLIRSTTYGMVLASAGLLGVGGGALNGATNTLVSDLHSDPRRKASALNLLGVFFGFGALFLPFTIGALLEALGLQTILWLAVVLSAAPAAVFLVLAFPPAKQQQGVPMAEVKRLVRHPLLLLIAFLLFFESGNEFILGGYISSYLVRESASSVRAASYVLAGYWAAIMLTRIASSRLLFRVKDATLVLASAALTAAGVAMLMASRSLGVGAIAVVLIGVGCASIYPTVLAQAGSRFAEYSGTAFGIIFAIALVGGMTLPWAVGQIAARWGLRSGLALPVVNAAMIFILQTRIMRKE
jgi:MFS transporter, FHS family, glucose/mannose:H+ symporter